MLWTIDNELQPFTFERLCTDLMFRNGYKSIVPFGKVRDHGRDAQVSLYKGKDNCNRHIVFFQYSLEKGWEGKLKREIIKVESYKQEIDSFVFITSQSVSGEKRDKLEKEFTQDHNCELIIFDREWLRLQLEEANKDLANKYLGISSDILSVLTKEVMKPSVPTKDQEEYAWKLFSLGKYEEALPKLRDLIKTTNDANASKGIAWCQYILGNYKEALQSIEIALSIDPTSRELLSVKACILAESGISTNSRPKLILSKQILLGLLEIENTWKLYYNLGNVLAGLMEYDEAKTAYYESIKLDNNIAEVWNNLGTCLHHLQEHEEELLCFDQAISINPDLTQAFVSKANTLGGIYGKYEEAINMLDFSISRDPKTIDNFPYFWYWRARFLLELNEFTAALESIEIALKEAPDNNAYLDMKAHILSSLWSVDSLYLGSTKDFFVFRTYSDASDFRSFLELAKIYQYTNEIQKAFESIKNAINILSPMPEIEVDELKLLGFGIDELISSIYYIEYYNKFRQISPLAISYSLDKDVYKLSWICFLVTFKDMFETFYKYSKQENQLITSDINDEATLSLLSIFQNPI